MDASIVTLVSNRVATGPMFRKLLISLTNDPAVLFADARQSGKFFDTWSIHATTCRSGPNHQQEEISRSAHRRAGRANTRCEERRRLTRVRSLGIRLAPKKAR